MKFHKDKAIWYWILMIGEKIMFAAILGVKSSWGMYGILGVKTVMVFYYGFADLFFEKIQKIRSVVTHILHLILILIFVLNEQCFKPQNILVPISAFFIEYIYASLLGCVLLISFAFYIREFMNHCEADFRQE